MTGPLDDDFEPTPDDTITAGRGTPFTDVGEWVVVAQVLDPKTGELEPICDRACRIYWIFRAHVNHTRFHADGSPDERVWPKQDDIAEMIGVAKYDALSKGIKQLVAIGAIDVKTYRHPTDPMRRRNVYTVHREPPPGYTGPLSVNEWYAHRAARRTA